MVVGGLKIWKCLDSLTMFSILGVATLIGVLSVSNVVVGEECGASQDGGSITACDSNSAAPVQSVALRNAVILTGQCDQNIASQPNFDPVRFVGRWYEIASYYSESSVGTCNGASYSLNPDGSVGVVNREVVDQTLREISGFAVLASTDGSAILNVTLEVIPNVLVQQELRILSTDYDNYAVSYSCININDNQKQVLAWIVSRTKEPTTATLTAINQVIAAYDDLDTASFLPSDQSEEACFYFPEAEAGKEVVFPGQCDDSIAAVANFDVNRFLGTWYEIEAYPKDDQLGECISHVYSASTTSAMQLTSIQVVDQIAAESPGAVNFTSTDGSAKFTITFEFRGNVITIPYWILGTDYDTYALAYTCVNIDSDFRGIFAWKLSRTRTLSADANTIINIISSNNVVLDNGYFEPTDHSEAACFAPLPYIPVGNPIVLPGQCDPNIPVVLNFDAVSFAGRWNEIASYYSESATGTCSGAEYSINADGSVGVINREIIDQSLRTISGFATVASNDGSAILDVILEVLPSVFIQQELRVLATDYTNYAISYSCQNINAEQKRVFAWIVSRARQFSPEIQATVNSIISSYPDLNNGYLTPTDQTDEGCFYFPEPTTTSPVIFPGTCDLSIPAMPNFDPVAYMGLWYEIEGYPSTFQQGTCNNAFYTLIDGVVVVYNTQVVGQSLDEIYGTGVIASTDGSAKLTVSFPVDGNPNVTVETSYWVLDTDYTSYALVYTCENLGNDQRAVFSWKLSRSKQLAAQASETINNIINTIPVLDNRYYAIKDQTVDGCFYIPTPETGKEVVFPGSCNDNIAVVTNFDLSQFLGTWYEVAAYPKDDQPGQCISHQYAQLTATTASIASSQVNDQVLYISDGNISYANNDNSGRLVITIIVDGEEITIPFWILAVDYNNFALAYSCVEIDNDFRGIYAWKLSRSRELSVIANVAINNIIENSDVVLDNAYFEPTDQSDVACFSLPNIPAGQPIILPGQCDTNITVVQNFDAGRFVGTWYEHASYFSESATGTCNTANYAANPDGSVSVVNSEVLNQSLRAISGLATVASADGSAILDVTLEIFPGTFVRQELLILASDYESFAISYSCDNIDATQKRVFAFILSRTRQITPEALAAVNQVINNYVDLNNAYFRLSDQSDEGCFYFPELVAGQPVIFPGTCDLDIPAMPNFDPVAYMGLWHEIEGYPSTFQQGTCNNAFYTLIDGVVAVYNTQVIGQRLDEIDGSAVIASTDGSAKLTVSFPVDGNPNVTVQTSYWVLDTDYVSYALVYTCENLGNDNRAVFSWKLSRSKQLSAAASTTIDNIISTIPVLDARYYQAKDQSVQGCFYFPTPAPGVEVVFPGQCSDAITAVPNFNMALFAGTWYEIEAYPKDDQPGECINHEYALLSANSLSITSTQIADNFLAISSGVVNFDGTDGSGKLTITFNFQGNQITIPFWILAIDYNSFAIAYSCVNANEDFRGIWAWKLSRTRELTVPANLAINSIINNIDVLDNVYFEPTNHSDQACAVLPEIPAGEPIILDGQCDLNIPVVQNFDATRYQGRWRLIETYPSEFQFGTCNDATYTLNNGVVDVLNSQVIDQTLDTITGTAVLATTDGSAKLLVTFPANINGEITTVTTEYWVLDTDYDSYSLVYTCVNINNQQRQLWSWKMSRTASLTPTAVENINSVVNSIDVLNNRYYEAIDQSDSGCFYFPEVDATRPVVFRGQCDDTIPAMPNFDPTRYTGLWYEIEGYPSTFQQGTCNNAFYELVGGVVDVYNTQVVNQTLDEIYGTAVVASTDGTAKLTVTFPVDGNPDVSVSTSYWVLDTDYETYSLVYTCENLSADSRAIFSWKLSRTKQLSAAASTVMTNIINTVDVLDQRYYEVKDQTDEGCFFYPEAIPGEPVYFPGTCDDSIATVTDLDVARFAGFWYEVSAYPKDEQQGTCVSYNFNVQSPTAISLVSTQIVDLNYDVTTATMIRAGTDNSRFTITINVGTGTITIPYWILATDYDNYALAYSCVNIAGSDRRGVYSWKLSRTTELSAASTTAITQVIAPIEVLEEPYFQPTGQSEDACFFLPEVIANQPVDFPGQCDTSIPGMPNFDPTRYTGRWFDIESYFDVFQDGTCNDALYTLTPEGIVDVYNTQVVAQTLDTINGTAVLASTDGSGKLLVTFPVAGTDFNIQAEYWILDTDYESYSLVYSCTNNPATNTRRVYSWKLSRTRQLTDNARTAIDNVIQTINVLDQRYYVIRDHSPQGCFYYPDEVNIGQAVIFPGQCDESIQPVQNFDAVRYTGFWYDVASYPQEFQFGSCPTATYTFNPVGFVEVYNTQVNNQTLDDINGVAVVSSTDGSAKLSVTFPIAGTDFTIDSPYWVLATDYDNYALVYACLNVGPETRRVTSWKLSRQPTLSAEGTAVINNVIDSIDVIDERYFFPQSHTEEACSYVPSTNGEPVVFWGQCDNGVQAVANFDLARFAGSWYEISAYPKDEQEGTCVRYDFTVSTASAFSLVTNQVIDGVLDITNANVVQVATDGTARFTININVNGNEIVIPYWIIATDYESYALAYTCVDYFNVRQGVFAWKLSRSLDLSLAANTAITQTINSIAVLDDQYFEETDQSANGCFVLPEPTPGEPAIFDGQCDESIAVVQNFDPVRYQGKWYDIESYYDTFQDGTCNDAEYTLTPAGIVDVYNTQVVNQTLDTINGTAVLASTDGSGKLLVTFPIAGTDFTIDAQYWILDTDYDSYSFVYSCTNLNNNQRLVYSWKLSRTRQLSTAATTAINAIVSRVNVLDNSFYIVRDHSPAGCFYYPDFEIGTAVNFRGQCDENLPVVQNFDVLRYGGFWYDVASYPQQFQFGSCPTANYTFNPAGFVEVYNTQVFEQSLDDIIGVAVVASTDGSAKLRVTFPIMGGDQAVGFIDWPYWVLATDYDNYALVYSCMNLDSETRRVTSWKLSRQPTLSDIGDNVINSFINSVDVLDERYFQPQSHDDETCFYYPRVTEEPVIFPGQCDDNVETVSNFDLQRFAGIWNELAAYPKDEQQGECVNYDFSVASANSFSLVSSQVLNDTLDITNAVLVQTSNDGSARFSITLNVNGLEIVIPYWIVATDYDNYALAYSCVNYENNRRGVYGWKLSRTKEFSLISSTAIDITMSRIDVLDERYFINVDQSNDGCFYLPDVALNTPVVFRGQCDDTIPAVQNFDPVRYQGQWYDIESYYDTFQMGSCNDALYTLTPQGIVDVYNTQVVNQALDTINGTAVLASTDGSGKLLVTFPVAGTTTTINAEYWILDTDYDSYSFVYSCTNLPNDFKQVFSWKLSRTRQLSDAAQTAISTVINRVDVLNDRYYVSRDHSETGCFYYPDFVPGQAVNFRGQCNENLAVVQNFDAARYMGLWYDTASYPQEFQFGSCATATYTLNPAGFVEVYNTQVVNQQLDEINGTAVVASTDGSAKLLVTFPIAGTDASIVWPYWVLATDYDNYALVYSCMNINTEQYRVTSWKLSRQPALTAASNTAINQVVATVPVLDDRYYQVQDNSDEACRVYPRIEDGPIILPGVCDSQTVVSNFNVNAFAGTWYETAQFRSEYTVGECASASLGVAGNSLSLTQSIVLNEEQVTITGTLVAPNDGSGALSATFVLPNGETRTAVINVLATDYTSYALLHSCSNLGTDSKQLFSWKLSRTRAGLTDQAASAITAVVSATDELFEPYYREADQSTDACFYYPDVDGSTASSIVLPGSCPQGIVGALNFDAAAYLGRWYEIESLPVPSQQGECARAEYSLGAGVVDVYNTIVYNETLEEQPGIAVVASTDGTGVLDVTFVLTSGEVVQANYYILDTDYINYALVYSCRNLEDGNSQVSSWILSRQRTLATQFYNLLEPIIANTRGLRRQYYRVTSQSDEACFYVPTTFSANEGVIFPGQCDENLSSADGFQIERYLGWWHEIEAYPSADNSGSCPSTVIRTETSQYFADDTRVNGLVGSVTTSLLQVSDNGRLRRFLPNGEISDVWVLATDFENYALLYSCVNIDSENRRVWSAKHSRSRQLSNAQQVEMQSTIDNINVLRSQFYLPQDQSDEACFHYPDITGRRVIIPGQCDQNIPVVQNFDPVEYGGTWYQIEKYPQQWESGTCVGARYTLNEETGVVNVVNWEVINGVLDTIEGGAVLISTDGSARLLVTLPVVGTDATTTFELNVLATDYVSYALAYSCENVNAYQRSIGAWKLSRTRNLPIAGAAAINGIISQRPELHEPYFIQIEQSDTCVEPEPVISELTPSSGIPLQSSLIIFLACFLLQGLF